MQEITWDVQNYRYIFLRKGRGCTTLPFLVSHVPTSLLLPSYVPFPCSTCDRPLPYFPALASICALPLLHMWPAIAPTCPDLASYLPCLSHNICTHFSPHVPCPCPIIFLPFAIMHKCPIFDMCSALYPRWALHFSQLFVLLAPPSPNLKRKTAELPGIVAPGLCYDTG